MHNYKELKIWQRAMEYAEEIYKLTALLPSDEKFGLISQLRRSAVSVASNIAASVNITKKSMSLLHPSP